LEDGALPFLRENLRVLRASAFRFIQHSIPSRPFATLRVLRGFAVQSLLIGIETVAVQSVHAAGDKWAGQPYLFQNIPLSFRPVQNRPNKVMVATRVAQWDQSGMRVSNGRGSGRAVISLTRSAICAG
jgi:hypothetical protein